MAPRKKGRKGGQTKVPEECASVHEEVVEEDDDLEKEEDEPAEPTYKVEDAIADFFEANPLFYDKGHPDFKNKQKKNALMEKFSKTSGLGIKLEDIARKFKSHRTEYVRLKRLKKGKSGSGKVLLTSLQRWKLERYQFLDPFCVSKLPEDLGSIFNTENSEEGIEEEAEEDGNVVAGTSTGGTTPCGSHAIGSKGVKRPNSSDNPNSKKKAVTTSSLSDVLAKFLHDTEKEKSRAQKEVENLAKESQQPVDERFAWSQWLTSTCFRVPPAHFYQYQRETFETTMRWLPNEPAALPGRPMPGPPVLAPPRHYTPHQGYTPLQPPTQHNTPDFAQLHGEEQQHSVMGWMPAAPQARQTEDHPAGT
ncbi:uncharacterized protein LOC118405332 [Branchiostoma floridae]|uniref:Uncharacterized protein LOC118405332 n=1 Tax=Branchiostoma floridae TaxID=7739 RepID=A0A9J7HJ84_BRAFL|nr:uncharacterized protein LOC118405332 [Branchiostoma floridae]